MRRLLLLAPIVALAAIGYMAFAAEDVGKCPISGKPAKESSLRVVNGEKVFCCCDNCPKAYVKKEGVKDEGAKKCAVSGEDADPDQKMVVTKTEAIYFCCDNCPKAYAKKHFAKADGK